MEVYMDLDHLESDDDHMTGRAYHHDNHDQFEKQDDDDIIPEEIRLLAQEANEGLLPTRSKQYYEKTFSKFKKWRIEKGVPASNFSETTFCKHFILKCFCSF